MPGYKVPQGTVDAARALLAEFNHMNIDQVYSIQLRERDSNDDEAKVLHLIPIGGVLGVAILPQGQAPKDEELKVKHVDPDDVNVGTAPSDDSEGAA